MLVRAGLSPGIWALRVLASLLALWLGHVTKPAVLCCWMFGLPVWVPSNGRTESSWHSTREHVS